MIIIRDSLMYIHYVLFKMDLDCNMWFFQQACNVQDCYID
jgi:hypothetical protein